LSVCFSFYKPTFFFFSGYKGEIQILKENLMWLHDSDVHKKQGQNIPLLNELCMSPPKESPLSFHLQ